MRNNMKRLFVITFLIAFSNVSIAQTNSTYEEGVNYGKSRIKTITEIINTNDILFSENIVEYYSESAHSFKKINLEDVVKVEYSTGNYGTTGSIIGALVGSLAGAAISLSTAKEEVEIQGNFEVTTTTYQAWPIYVIGGIGSLIGLGIGNGIDRWKIIYQKENLTSIESVYVSPIWLDYNSKGKAMVAVGTKFVINF